MNKLDPFSNTKKGGHQRKFLYVPPEPSAIKAYALTVCEQLAQENPVYSKPEVVGNFASFLNFVAECLAKSLNSEHKEYLLEGYEPLSGTKGMNHVNKKSTVQKTA